MSDSCLSYILDNLRHTFFSHKDKLKLEKLQHKVFFHAKNNRCFVVFTPMLVSFHCKSFSGFISKLKNNKYIYLKYFS